VLSQIFMVNTIISIIKVYRETTPTVTITVAFGIDTLGFFTSDVAIAIAIAIAIVLIPE